ncbi:unnamed protein product [Lupinus luteus]|uniref:Mediator of RNA polymerase II transcription subunit 6 n=1 Tax=Lupinus luteus TaxID=3873 RepID=A0AAV1YN46_LUPLU
MGSTEGLGSSMMQFGVTKPISMAGPMSADFQRTKELEKSSRLCQPDMATPPPMGPPGNPMFEGGPPPPQPPGTDMTGICFRDQLWLNTYPLDRNLVFDYFAMSPFYDWTCNNEQLRVRSVHPLDISNLTKMTGIEYILSEVLEPHLFVIRKQKRDSPEKVTPMLAYYILDGSIYQAPQLCNVFAARIGRTLHHIQKAFTIAASKLEKIGYGKQRFSCELFYL